MSYALEADCYKHDRRLECGLMNVAEQLVMLNRLFADIALRMEGLQQDMAVLEERMDRLEGIGREIASEGSGTQGDYL